MSPVALHGFVPGAGTHLVGDGPGFGGRVATASIVGGAGASVGSTAVGTGLGASAGFEQDETSKSSSQMAVASRSWSKRFMVRLLQLQGSNAVSWMGWNGVPCGFK